MSKLETNTIDTVSGTTNLTIGSTNTSTITMPNGALSGQNYPAFEAYLSASQTVSDNVHTKVEINAEIFDTDNAYDNSTNYRFTPQVAGKYFCYARLRSSAGANNTGSHFVYIQKNGDSNTRIAGYVDFSADKPGNYTQHVGGIQEMNGSTDYIEFYGRVDDSSGSPDFVGNSNQRYTAFGAYRIGA